MNQIARRVKAQRPIIEKDGKFLTIIGNEIKIVELTQINSTDIYIGKIDGGKDQLFESVSSFPISCETMIRQSLDKQREIKQRLLLVEREQQLELTILEGLMLDALSSY